MEKARQAEDDALDDAIPEYDFQLDTAEEDAAQQTADRQGSVDIGEADIIAKARRRLYGDIDTMPQKDVLAIYVAGSRLEEARLKAMLSRKKGPADEGVDNLVKTASAAIRAARGSSD